VLAATREKHEIKRPITDDLISDGCSIGSVHVPRLRQIDHRRPVLSTNCLGRPVALKMSRPAKALPDPELPVTPTVR
jgi:hypothetical protein